MPPVIVDAAFAGRLVKQATFQRGRAVERHVGRHSMDIAEPQSVLKYHMDGEEVGRSEAKN